MPSPSHHSTPSNPTHSSSLRNALSKALSPSHPFHVFPRTLYHVFFPQSKRSCFVSIQTMGKIVLYPAFSILECGEFILKFIVIIIIITLASKWALFTCVGVARYFHFQTYSSYLCMYTLCYDNVSSSDCSIECWDDHWTVNWKGYGRKWQCSNWRYNRNICLDWWCKS
jgi:hypothetical protein